MYVPILPAKFMGVPNYPPEIYGCPKLPSQIPKLPPVKQCVAKGDTLSDWMPGQARHDDRGARRHSYRNYPLSQIAWADKFGTPMNWEKSRTPTD